MILVTEEVIPASLKRISATTKVIFVTKKLISANQKMISGDYKKYIYHWRSNHSHYKVILATDGVTTATLKCISTTV